MILLEIYGWVKGTDFSSKILDISGNQIKTNTTKSVSLIFCKHSLALLWYVVLYLHMYTIGI